MNGEFINGGLMNGDAALPLYGELAFLMLEHHTSLHERDALTP